MFKMIIAASLLTIVGLSAQAMADEAICATPGSVIFDGIPESRDDIIPSEHRQISGLGRLAFVNHCSVVVTCVSDPSFGEEAKSIRDRTCAAVRSTLSAFESRNSVRSRIARSSYSIVKVPAGPKWAAGTVTIRLK